MRRHVKMRGKDEEILSDSPLFRARMGGTVLEEDRLPDDFHDHASGGSSTAVVPAPPHPTPLDSASAPSLSREQSERHQRDEQARLHRVALEWALVEVETFTSGEGRTRHPQREPEAADQAFQPDVPSLFFSSEGGPPTWPRAREGTESLLEILLRERAERAAEREIIQSELHAAERQASEKLALQLRFDTMALRWKRISHEVCRRTEELEEERADARERVLTIEEAVAAERADAAVREASAVEQAVAMEREAAAERATDDAQRLLPPPPLPLPREDSSVRALASPIRMDIRPGPRLGLEARRREVIALLDDALKARLDSEEAQAVAERQLARVPAQLRSSARELAATRAELALQKVSTRAFEERLRVQASEASARYRELEERAAAQEAAHGEASEEAEARHRHELARGERKCEVLRARVQEEVLRERDLARQELDEQLADALMQKRRACNERDLSRRACEELKEELDEMRRTRERVKAELAGPSELPDFRPNAISPSRLNPTPSSSWSQVTAPVASPFAGPVVGHHWIPAGLDSERKRELLRLMGV